MRKITEIIFASGLALAVLISNIGSFMRDGRDLDRLRGKVLRLHILANSDSEEDQRLKLTVRDELLKSGIPAASEVEDDKETEKDFFSEKECDIMYKPQKYEVRFALWDKIKEIIG